MTSTTSSGVTAGSRSTGVAAASRASYSSPSRAVRRHLDDALDAGQPVAELLDQRHQLGADEQHPRARVVDGVVDLVAGQPEVDDRVGRADRERGEGQLHAGRVVLVEERHHVAAADPQCPAGLRRAGAPGRTTAPRSTSGSGTSPRSRRASPPPSAPVGRPGRRDRRASWGSLSRARGPPRKPAGSGSRRTRRRARSATKSRRAVSRWSAYQPASRNAASSSVDHRLDELAGHRLARVASVAALCVHCQICEREISAVAASSIRLWIAAAPLPASQAAT